MSDSLCVSHLAMLERFSAIPLDVITQRGYRTISNKRELTELGFAPAQCNVPGLLIPVYSVDGHVRLHQYRPDNPRVIKGKQVKYETPKGTHLVIDCLVGRERLRAPAEPLWITEGIKKVDSALGHGLCCIGLLGVEGWRGTNEVGGKTALPEWNDIALNGRTVYIAFDSDVMQKEPVRRALKAISGYLVTKGAAVRYVHFPGGEEKIGLDDWFKGGGTVEELVSAASESVPGAEIDEQKLTLVDRILALAMKAGLTLFKDEAGKPYCTYPRGGSLESCSAGNVKGFLVECIRAAGLQLPTGRTLDEVAERCDTLARYGDVMIPTARRIHSDKSGGWLYLNDSNRAVVRIDSSGFSPVPAKDLPVRFVPSSTMEALPNPKLPHEKPKLCQFLNIDPGDECIAWGFLVGCFLPRGTMPVLIAQGEQGSGKTFGASLIRQIVDPNSVNLAPLKQDDGSLRARIRSGHIVGYDNVSRLTGEFSDLLCSLVSGTGFAARALYSDADEHVVSARQPVILNGITDFADRSDLADRTLVLPFRRLDGTGQRKGEGELMASFEAMHPEILGEVLTRVSRAYREWERTTIPPDSGRLIDLIRFVEASEPEDEKGNFRRAYQAARQEQHESAADTDPLIRAIVTLVSKERDIMLPNAELLAQLTAQEFGDRYPSRGWPQTTQALSHRLSRDIPKLRSLGVEAERERGTKGQRGWHLVWVTPGGDTPRAQTPAGVASPALFQVQQGANVTQVTPLTPVSANTASASEHREVRV